MKTIGFKTLRYINITEIVLLYFQLLKLEVSYAERPKRKQGTTTNLEIRAVKGKSKSKDRWS